MPTIDTETYQFVTLVLLGVVTLAALIALMMLSRIRKALKERPVASLEMSAQVPDAQMFESISDQNPIIDPDAEARATEEARRQAEEAEIRRSQQGAEEAAAQARAAEQEAADRAAAAATTQGTPQGDPIEQPFERDGRWWFRRGDELLVYEERTGQWITAGEPAGAQSTAPDAGTAVSENPTSGGGVATEQQPGDAGFWKCPTCGAVNGSTATSCRMCFTQRPQGA